MKGCKDICKTPVMQSIKISRRNWKQKLNARFCANCEIHYQLQSYICPCCRRTVRRNYRAKLTSEQRRAAYQKYKLRSMEELGISMKKFTPIIIARYAN